MNTTLSSSSATAPSGLAMRIHEAFPAGSYCIPGLLRILEVVETDAVPSAAVQCVARPRLLMNPAFVDRHANTPEKLIALVMHEIHHVLLGHTRLMRRVTALDNLVFDAVINALVCRVFPERAATAFFTDFYDHARFPECFLRPAPGWHPSLTRQQLLTKGVVPRALTEPATFRVTRREAGRLRGLHASLDSPDGAGYDELREALLRVRGVEQRAEGVELIGDHSSEADRASSAGALEERSPILLEGVRMIVERWPMPPDPIVGRSYASILKGVRVPPCAPASADMLESLLRRIAGTRRGGSFRRLDATEAEVLSPIPRMSRRTLVLKALGAPPLLHPATVAAPRITASGERVHVYLDVSGSVMRLIGPLVTAVLRVARHVHPTVHLFSTEVADATLADLLAGRIRTTGGTNIACVAEHARRQRVRRAVMITDGHVGAPSERDRATLEALVLGVALTEGGSTRADLEGLVDAWAEMEQGGAS